METAQGWCHRSGQYTHGHNSIGKIIIKIFMADSCSKDNQACTQLGSFSLHRVAYNQHHDEAYGIYSCVFSHFPMKLGEGAVSLKKSACGMVAHSSSG